MPLPGAAAGLVFAARPDTAAPGADLGFERDVIAARFIGAVCVDVHNQRR